jgi:chromosomal replication initiation ATPase DnaA
MAAQHSPAPTVAPGCDLIGLHEAVEDLLAARDRDMRTVGYRSDLWNCLAAALAADQPGRNRFIALIRWVSFETGVPVAVVCGNSQATPAWRARLAVAWGGRYHLGLSFPEIGRKLGDRDQSTIRRCVSRAMDMISTDPAFCSLITRLQLASEGGKF